MIRLWSWDAPLRWPSSNCSRPSTRSPSRSLSQKAAPEPIPPSPTTIASHSRPHATRRQRERPPLDQLDPAADLDHAVGPRPDDDLRADALADRERPPQLAAHHHRRGPVASSSAIPKSVGK